MKIILTFVKDENILIYFNVTDIPFGALSLSYSDSIFMMELKVNSIKRSNYRYSN